MKIILINCGDIEIRSLADLDHNNSRSVNNLLIYGPKTKHESWFHLKIQQCSLQKAHFLSFFFFSFSPKAKIPRGQSKVTRKTAKLLKLVLLPTSRTLVVITWSICCLCLDCAKYFEMKKLLSLLLLQLYCISKIQLTLTSTCTRPRGPRCCLGFNRQNVTVVVLSQLRSFSLPFGESLVLYVRIT